MKKILSILTIITVLIGCDNYLEEDIKTFTSPEVLMDSKTGIESAVLATYDYGADFWRGLSCHLFYTVTTDEGLFPAPVGTRYELCSYTLNSANSDLMRGWNAFTGGINHANMVLDFFPEAGTLNIPDEARFLEIKKGEVLFLRAWYYFIHMNTFGNVPLVTTYKEAELFPPNSTVPEIYAQIIADLKEAETMLPGWQESANEPGRTTRGAAKSLLGRVYLTKATSGAAEASDFQNALAKFQEVIDNEGYDLWNSYKVAFLPENKNGKEDIFSIQCLTDFGSSSHYRESVSNPSPYGNHGYQQIRTSRLLFDSFEPGDKRKEDGWWEDGSSGLIYTGDYVNRVTGQIHNTVAVVNEKFIDPDMAPVRSNNFSTNYPLIRYADVLLMYAEAQNEVNNGPNTEAYWAVNKVRTRAGLEPLSDLSKEEFFEALVAERFHELWFENIRWFDLKRWNRLRERVLMREHITGYPEVLPIEIPKHLVKPIPLSELEANPNLVQNPYWN